MKCPQPCNTEDLKHPTDKSPIFNKRALYSIKIALYSTKEPYILLKSPILNERELPQEIPIQEPRKTSGTVKHQTEFRKNI